MISSPGFARASNGLTAWEIQKSPMSDDEAVDNANTAPPDAAPSKLSAYVRYVCLLQASDGQWYYRAEGANREPVYTSETFTRKSDAKEAAIREHSTIFEYVLEFEDEDGVKVRETL